MILVMYKRNPTTNRRWFRSAPHVQAPFSGPCLQTQTGATRVRACADCPAPGDAGRAEVVARATLRAGAEEGRGRSPFALARSNAARHLELNARPFGVRGAPRGRNEMVVAAGRPGQPETPKAATGLDPAAAFGHWDSVVNRPGPPPRRRIGSRAGPACGYRPSAAGSAPS